MMLALLINISVPTLIVAVVLLPLLYRTLRRTRQFLQRNLVYVLDWLFWILGKLFVQSLASRISLRQYCRIQLEKTTNRYLQVPGKTQFPLETDAIFVPLTLDVPGSKPLTSNVSKMAELGSRIRIIGDPGSGKSSLTKKIFRDACRQTAGDTGRLPILIELKYFSPPLNLTASNDAFRAWALENVKKVVTDVEGYEMGQLFDNYSTGRGLLVLLDGLDEVASDAYRTTVRAIESLSATLSDASENNIIILTMRTQFYHQVRADFDDLFPPVLQITPFTPSDIYSFLQRWPFPKKEVDEVVRIYADLTDRPTLREMCRNPLVLAMYVASDQRDADTRAPDTRTAFYDQVVEELLVTRRSRQLGVSARTTLRERREALLGRIALTNLLDHAQPVNLIKWNTAIDIAIAVWGCESREDAEKQLRELAKDTGLITEEREGEALRFIHLTFCEFLAAKEAAQGQKDGWANLIVSYRDFRALRIPHLQSRLNEVIPFCVALLPRAVRPQAIDDVAKLNSQEILGRCFLETQAYGNAVWKDYIARETKEILGHDPAQWDDAWLERLHLFNVILKDAEEWGALAGRGGGVSLEDTFASIVGSDRERLARVFTSYAGNDPAAALRLADSCGVDLAGEQPELVIKCCLFPPFLTLALQRAASELHDAFQWIDLLAEAGLRHPFVAHRLHDSSTPARLKQLAEVMPAKTRWAPLSPWTLKNGVESAYGAILSLAATARTQKGAPHLHALRIVKQLPPPGSLRFRTARWRILILPVAFAAIAAAVALRMIKYLPGTVAPWLIGTLLVITLWRIYLQTRAELYAKVANILPHHLDHLVLTMNATRTSTIMTMSRSVLHKVFFRRLAMSLRDLSWIRNPYLLSQEWPGGRDIAPDPAD